MAVCQPVSHSNITFMAHEGDNMIVSEIAPAYASDVTIEEKVLHGDSPLPVSMNLVDSGCDQVPTYHTEISNSSNTTLHNITTVYLLSGSSIEYNFSASLHCDVYQAIEVFIVKGIEKILSFHPNKDRNYTYSKRVPIDSPKTYQSIHYNVTSHGYYALFILLPACNKSTDFSYSVYLQVINIDMEVMNFSRSHILSGDSERWKQGFNFEHCNHRKCLIANVGSPPTHSHHKPTHLIVSFTPRSSILDQLSAFSIILTIFMYSCGYLSLKLLGCDRYFNKL